MPIDLTLKGYLLLMLVLMLGLLGIMLVIMLATAWRRYIRRQHTPRQRRPQNPALDPWETSARRLEVEKDDDEIDEDEYRDPFGR